ncbi:MAG: type II secretion system protein [Akkermansia sp.]|nr:type II secretion system protein [Akkermansia sp.]
MKYRTNKPAAGFTLIEILVVIAILATLAAGAWTAKGWIDNKQLTTTAESHIGLMSQAMNAYRADNGDILPHGKGDAISANILYTALYCDEDNDGNPDKDENGSTRMPYCEQLIIIENTKSKEREEGIPCIKIKLSGKDVKGKKFKGKRYAIIDPWNNPYRYRLGCEVADEDGKVGMGINPDFDIFSLGPDAKGDGLTKDGDNTDNISNIQVW